MRPRVQHAGLEYRATHVADHSALVTVKIENGANKNSCSGFTPRSVGARGRRGLARIIRVFEAIIHDIVKQTSDLLQTLIAYNYKML